MVNGLAALVAVEVRPDAGRTDGFVIRQKTIDDGPRIRRVLARLRSTDSATFSIGLLIPSINSVILPFACIIFLCSQAPKEPGRSWRTSTPTTRPEASLISRDAAVRRWTWILAAASSAALIGVIRSRPLSSLRPSGDGGLARCPRGAGLATLRLSFSRSLPE